MAELDVAAIVLNWRTPELAERCIDSLLESRFDGSLCVILVDNDSRDGSAERLRARFGDAIEVIESAENRGYAGGMNLGLVRTTELRATYAFLLNADTELNPESLAELHRAAEEKPEGAFFGPRVLDAGKPEDRWFVGGRWDWAQGTIRVVRESAADGLPRDPRRIEFVNGAAMFVRMSALGKTGMFDEHFGLYFEESDLCSRATRAGFTLWHVPRACVRHVCGASTSIDVDERGLDAGQYYRTRNRLLWGRRNLTGLRAAAFWFHVVLRWPVKYLCLLLSGQAGKRRGFAMGIRDFAAGNFGMRNISEE